MVTNDIYNIYALINPLNSEPFYVGATRLKIRDRLMAHVYLSRQDMYWAKPESISIIYHRHLLIRNIELSGLSPYIILLNQCNAESVDEMEHFYYNKMIEYGAVLIQSLYRFVYQSHFCK